MSARDPDALRRILGNRPLVEPSATALSEDEAWRRVALELSLEESRAVRRTPWWIGALAAAAAGAAALFLLLPGQPAPEQPHPAAPVATAVPLAPLPPLPALPTAGVEAEGAAVSVLDGARASLVAERGEIAQGSHVRTARGEAKLRFPGGSVTLLEASSSVQLARLAPDDLEIALETGAIFVHAAPLGQKQLAVRAGAYRVIVHGTGFRVERKAGQVEVGLWHGSVEIRPDGAAKGVMLAPGHRLRFSEARGLAGVVARSLGEAQDKGAAEEARLLGLPAPKTSRRAVAAGDWLPPAAVSDVERCRASFPGDAATSVRIGLTLGDDGEVLQANLDQAGTKLGGCVAEAALRWKLPAPPPGLRGVQRDYDLPVK